MDAFPLLLILIVVAVVGGTAVWWHQEQARRTEAALDQLLAQRPGWQRADHLCGLTADRLAGDDTATPRGDRRYGLEHVVAGPLTAEIDQQRRPVDVGVGHWWYEVRRTSTDGRGHTSTRYERRRVPVAAARLPGSLPAPITIGPESVFGRIGLTRGGHQLESDGFNRRFRVDGGDRTLTVTLLDARLQSHLVDRYAGRTLRLRDDLLLLGGDPTTTDTTLFGPIRDLPGLCEDLEDLLAHLPPPFWRSLASG